MSGDAANVTMPGATTGPLALGATGDMVSEADADGVMPVANPESAPVAVVSAEIEALLGATGNRVPVEVDPTATQLLPPLSGALQADAHATAPPTPSPRRMPKLYVILRARNSMSVCWHAARNESRATWPGQPGARPPVRKPQGFGYV